MLTDFPRKLFPLHDAASDSFSFDNARAMLTLTVLCKYMNAPTIMPTQNTVMLLSQSELMRQTQTIRSKRSCASLTNSTANVKTDEHAGNTHDLPIFNASEARPTENFLLLLFL